MECTIVNATQNENKSSKFTEEATIKKIFRQSSFNLVKLWGSNSFMIHIFAIKNFRNH
jgi:hypothetical protein